MFEFKVCFNYEDGGVYLSGKSLTSVVDFLGLVDHSEADDEHRMRSNDHINLWHGLFLHRNEDSIHNQ